MKYATKEEVECEDEVADIVCERGERNQKKLEV